MFVLTVPYLWSVGSTGQNLWQAIAMLALLGSPVVLGFGFFGMGLGGQLASARAGLLAGLIALVVSASPLLLGPSLRQSAIGRTFDAVNPISSAVNAFDAVIIDSQTVASQWPHLAVAVLWLAAALCFAQFAFRRVSR
jgi:hypothetical protein